MPLRRARIQPAAFLDAGSWRIQAQPSADRRRMSSPEESVCRLSRRRGSMQRTLPKQIAWRSSRIPGELNLLGRTAEERARRIALDGFRQRAQVTSGHPQVLEDRPHIVLIVPEHTVETLGRFVYVPDDSIQLARFAHLAQALGEGRYVVHRLLQTRVREQLVEP